MRTILIGLGKRGKKYLMALKNSSSMQLVAVCDADVLNAKHIGQQYNVPAFCNIDQLLSSISNIDIAIVVVPHNAYLPIIEKLANHKIHIIKEKPYATSLAEAQQMATILQKNNIKMMVMTQRRFDKVYQLCAEKLNKIGKIFRIDGRYSFCIERLDEGWRASKTQAGGGVLMDMGYHIIDLLIWYFGLPTHLIAKTTCANRSTQNYDVEDTAIISFDYSQKHVEKEKMVGQIVLTRIGYKPQEKLIIYGSEGTLILKADSLRLLDKQGKIIDKIDVDLATCGTAIIEGLNHFVRYVSGKEHTLINSYQEHFQHLHFIENAYLSDNKNTIINLQNENNKKDYTWPLITPQTEQAVLNQLRSGEISIYNRSGVFKIFEDKFAAYHQMKYALVTNSGTSALFGLYEGIQIKPGDEVIVPAYTFFATASPIMHFGAKPVFCDCLADGTINPAEIEKHITPATKAVMITHMWGIPCDMDPIVRICQKYNIKLLEDCSHAHGARYKGRLVGTFGDGAAWSLQGQKIITGGEGGILLTNNQEIYIRAQLQGQYNKRCEQEIPKDHELRPFFLTGFGLKLRAHPLAISIANEQFDHLDNWLQQKSIYANYIISELASIPFLQMPDITNKQPAWYALVFNFIDAIAPCHIDEFIRELHANGLLEVDRPKSTAPIYKMALFTKPSDALPRLYQHNFKTTEACPMADYFYQSAIKLPVWARAEDKPIVEKYVNGIKQVAKKLITQSQIMYKNIKNQSAAVSVISNVIDSDAPMLRRAKL